jgi:hypothetical protein
MVQADDRLGQLAALPRLIRPLITAVVTVCVVGLAHRVHRPPVRHGGVSIAG